MAEPKNHLMHYRDGKRMALCGRMAYGSWFDEPERWGRLPSSEQCGHCRAALRRMGGVDGYMREALEARRAADEAEIAELTTPVPAANRVAHHSGAAPPGPTGRSDEFLPAALLDEVRSFARRVPVIRQLPARLDPVQLGGLLKSLTWAAVGALGKRSLKRSGLTRRLFAPGRDDARPRFASAHPSRPEFTR